MATLPNFVLAGAPKAGTTSLYHYLAQHPQVFMSPVKEPCFFSSEIRPENFADAQDLQSTSGLITEWPAYHDLFRDAGAATAIGEASVCYLWSPSAPANIAARIPHARILVVLRDPAARAFSQYIHGVTKGRIHWSFHEHVCASLRETDGRFRITWPLLEFGDYAAQIRRYLDHFLPSQLHIALYEDFQRDPAHFLRGALQFLEVDPAFTPNTSRRYHVYPERESLALDPADRRFLIDYYRDGILDLQHLLDRDLSAWLA